MPTAASMGRRWIFARSLGLGSTLARVFALPGQVSGVLLRVSPAHRFAWECANGAIPDGLCVLHRCDVKACVNVEHLWLGTRADNMQDMVSKGRNRNGSKKLTADQVRAIRASRLPLWMLSREYGISIATAGRIRLRKTHKHLS